MEETERLQSFSLLGGPLHWLGQRVGLVRGGTNTVALGLALGVFLWTVLAALAYAASLHQVFSLTAIAAHVRLLVVIPLFFLCETWVDPRMTAFVRMIVRSGVVPNKSAPALESEIARTVRRKDSWMAEAGCLVAAVLLSVSGQPLVMSGTTSAYDSSNAASGISAAGLWYWIVCLPLFRFLIVRWIWRLGLWSYFLWRVSRLELNLIPTHPDRAGGLGYLEVVQMHFAPLVLAISATEAASLAEEIVAEGMNFEAIYPGFALMLVIAAALFIGPMLIFTPSLWACRVKGLSDYMEFAADYVSRFDVKWVSAEHPPEERLLGTSDLQSLSDLSGAIRNVRLMRGLPVSVFMLVNLTVAALLPLVPLLLLKYPIAELTRKLFARLAGF
jgi:hypothetical protein